MYFKHTECLLKKKIQLHTHRDSVHLQLSDEKRNRKLVNKNWILFSFKTSIKKRGNKRQKNINTRKGTY